MYICLCLCLCLSLHATILFTACVSVCVCVCVRACVRVCVCCEMLLKSEYLYFYHLGLGHERLLLESVQEIHLWQEET